MNKTYVLDTNVLLDDPNAITVLRNGEENDIRIPFVVLEELDKLKNTGKHGIVSKAVNAIEDNLDYITIFEGDSTNKNPDIRILQDISAYKLNGFMSRDAILVTNDRLMRVIASTYGIKAQPYIKSAPEEDTFNGTSTEDNPVLNSFVYIKGVLNFWDGKVFEVVPKSVNVWGTQSKSSSQTMSLYLMLRDSIDIVSLTAVAGLGKTHIALASALYLAFEKNKFKNIKIIRPTIEMGSALGYLPGSIDEKVAVYNRPVLDLLDELTEDRKVSKLYREDGTINKRKFEILPVNFTRGINLKDTIIILDDAQNFTRSELRSILTRCGDNTKVILTGDTKQIDHQHLNKFNNGLTWINKLFQGYSNFAMVELTGKTMRGPITATTLSSGL